MALLYTLEPHPRLMVVVIDTAMRAPSTVLHHQPHLRKTDLTLREVWF